MFVEGYTDQLSYQAGEQVRFHVSTSANKYALEVTRIGAEREVVWQQDQLPGSSHPVPEDASSNGCGWPVSHSLEVPDDWRSGYYEFALRIEDQGGKFVRRGQRTAESRGFFIVRPSAELRSKPASPTDARILLQLATNTYSAYNNWGGYSFYSYHGRGGLQGHRVSFDRPMAGLFDRWELDFVEWAEGAGYALDYCANSDLEWHPELLDNYRLVLSVGHDEYWSAPMRDHLEAYIAAGGNAAFFSGNSVCWRVRSEDEGRALVCWKQQFNMDPAYAAGDYADLSTLWSYHLVDRPENELTGVGFLYGGYHLSHGQYMDGSGAFTVHRPEHWVSRERACNATTPSAASTPSSATSATAASSRWKTGYRYPREPMVPQRTLSSCALPRAMALGRLRVVRALGKGPGGRGRSWASTLAAARSSPPGQPTGRTGLKETQPSPRSPAMSSTG